MDLMEEFFKNPCYEFGMFFFCWFVFKCENEWFFQFSIAKFWNEFNKNQKKIIHIKFQTPVVYE